MGVTLRLYLRQQPAAAGSLCSSPCRPAGTPPRWLWHPAAAAEGVGWRHGGAWWEGERWTEGEEGEEKRASQLANESDLKSLSHVVVHN